MDGIDDSPLSLAVVRLADYTDRLTPNGLGATVVAVSLTIYYCSFGSRGDAVLVAAAAALVPPNALWHLLARYGQSALCGVLVAACSVLFLRLIALTAPRLFANDSVRWTESAGSFFIPSRTTHTRFFPKKHSFAYSYLTVGIPVGLRIEVNGILSVDPPLESAARGWWMWLKSPLYEVDGASHLARGRDEGGLREKLNRFLVGQSVDPSDYPHAFLVTAPKFLGYSFNPVSFWYLYSPDKVMSAMILEVNNTFDERRPYLVFRDFDQEAKHIQPLDPRPSNPRPSTDNTASRISASFEKDFHVSPFNSRKGSYSVLAKDPLGPGLATFRGLDVTINLRSSKGHPKLVARLVHQTPAIDVAEMTALHKLIFVGRWFWIGFATFPRIVKEAAILFFRRSLHVWFRPEPLPQSLGRHATTTERRLEAVFRDYLRHRVEQSPESLRVCYIPSGISVSTTEDVFASKAVATATTSPAYDVEIRVLTPVFYARFVHYAHDFEGLFNELAESRTVAVDKPDMLPHIFLKKGALPLRASGLVEYAAFRLIQALRRTPEPIRRPMTSAGDSLGGQASTCKPVDIRGFRISPMDAYVLEHGSDSLKSMYRSTVSRLFLADRFFLGSLELLSAVEFICRAGFAYLLVSAFYH